ncbi:MAG: hypothetical protein IPJ58_09665 [Ardenticatenia bacterium]|nr:hypothetical protein [Ardenticatenia bacterium]
MNQYDRLRASLDTFSDPAFRDIVRSFLTIQEINVIGEPIDRLDRGTFLGHVQRIARLDAFDRYLSKKLAESGGAKGALPRNRKGNIANQNARQIAAVPFTNRSVELERVGSSSHLVKYYVIDAPARYGKTSMLERLDRTFMKRRWQHALMSVKRDDTLKDITTGLAQRLGIVLADESSHSWGYRLSSSWRQSFTDKLPTGLAILLDLDAAVSEQLVSDLFNLFIPHFAHNLKVSQALKRMRFRVIVAGRNLSSMKQFKDSQTHELFSCELLGPFTYRVINESATLYLAEESDETISQLAAHVLYLTGGHPECMNHMFQDYKKMKVPPDEFIKSEAITSCLEVVRRTQNIIRQPSITEAPVSRQISEALSVFRYIDAPALEPIYMRAKESHPSSVAGIRDHFDLHYKLSSQNLFIKDDRQNPRFLSNARKFETITLRSDRLDVFASHCEHAKEICAARIMDRENPERWAVEYLFQFLQRNSHRIDDLESRIELRHEFMSDTLPNVLDLLLSTQAHGATHSRDHELSTLLREVDEEGNWEFRFLLNYTLRNELYSDDPLVDLRKRIVNFQGSTMPTMGKGLDGPSRGLARSRSSWFDLRYSKKKLLRPQPFVRG